MIRVDPIPRIIHQLWKTSKIPYRWRDCTESWKAHHPNWEHRLWTDEDAEHFVKVHYPGLRGVLDSFPYAIQRVDIMRYLILSVHGGVYVDLDMECLQTAVCSRLRTP
ncbi:MAG: glycosyltransferase [Syntrophobacteraceae bacterium]